MQKANTFSLIVVFCLGVLLGIALTFVLWGSHSTPSIPPPPTKASWLGGATAFASGVPTQNRYCEGLVDSSTYAQIVLGDNISWVFAGSTINLWRYNWQTNKWEPASQNFDTGDNLGATGTIDDAGNVLNVWFSYNAGLGVRTVSVTSKFWALANSKSLRGFSVTSDSPSVTGFWVKHYPKDPKTGKLIGGQLLPGLDCGGNFS